MAEWQDQLNSILSDPEAMAQIVSLAQSIGGQQGASAPPPPSPPEEQQAETGGIDPELLKRLGPMMAQLNRPESGEAAAFLQALRPFLSEKRRAKVERAAQLARLIHLGKTFLVTQEGDRRV